MLHTIDAEKINESAIRLIGSDWMLITAGDSKDFNTMTAAWGGLGFLWHRPVVYAFIRPTRHTYHFTEKYEHFSLSFFDESYREKLQFCGSHSGRDIDKIKETGLKPVDHEGKTIYFEQARIVFICKKIYTHDIDPAAFIDQAIHKAYPLKDYHRMYIGEIVSCLADQDPA